MKRVFAILLVIVMVLGMAACSSSISGDLESADCVSFMYKYSDENIFVELEEEDMYSVKEVLKDLKSLGSGKPSCGFNEDVALIFYSDESERKLLIANDTCGNFQLSGAEKYYGIEGSEMITIHKILEGYGGSWPCL
jgi:hypothetical protein